MKKQATKIVLMSWITVITISCGSNVRPTDEIFETGISTKNSPYIPPMRGSQKTYIAKPIYQGKDTSAVYISGGYSKGEVIQSGIAVETIDDASFYSYDTNFSKNEREIYSFNLHKGFTRENYNFHLGLGGSYGEFYLDKPYKNIISGNTKKEFYNINLNAGINYTVYGSFYEFRVIGIELIYNTSFGSYQNFLEDLKHKDNGSFETKQSPLISYYSSEFVFKITPDFSFSGGVFSGNKGLHSLLLLIGDSRGCFFNLQRKKYSFSYLYEKGFQSGNEELNSFGTSSFKLTYQFR